MHFLLVSHTMHTHTHTHTHTHSSLLEREDTKRAEALFDFLELNSCFQLLIRLTSEAYRTSKEIQCVLSTYWAIKLMLLFSLSVAASKTMLALVAHARV